MPSSISWSDFVSQVGDAFSTALKPVLADIWDEAKEDVQKLGAKAVKYLRAIAQGDTKAQKAYDSVIRKAMLIASRHLRDAGAAAQQGFIQAIEIALKVLVAILTAALA